MARGSGACAIATAAVEEGYAEVGIPVTVLLPGGSLTVTVAPDGEITLGGPAVTVYRGVYTWEVCLALALEPLRETIYSARSQNGAPPMKPGTPLSISSRLGSEM